MTTAATTLENRLALVFAPLDKRALGIALGAAIALLFASATVMSILRDPDGLFPLGLLRQFFYAYSVSWTGVFVGACWGFAVGFFWGWFFAFSRNLVLAIWLMTVRVRADIAASHVFLDHV